MTVTNEASWIKAALGWDGFGVVTDPVHLPRRAVDMKSRV